jgi:hypothetical protein
MTLFIMDYSFYTVTEFHFYGANIYEIISNHSLQLISAQVDTPLALFKIVGGIYEPHKKGKVPYLIN